MNQTDKKFSRRQVLGLFGAALVPFGASAKGEERTKQEYETLLKQDGTTVKVAVSKVAQAKVLKKTMNNRGFFNWIKKSK